MGTWCGVGTRLVRAWDSVEMKVWAWRWCGHKGDEVTGMGTVWESGWCRDKDTVGMGTGMMVALGWHGDKVAMGTGTVQGAGSWHRLHRDMGTRGRRCVATLEA